MTKSWLSFKCPCCGYEPKRNMTLQSRQALQSFDTATNAVVEEVLSIVDEHIHKKRMKTAYREQFVIGIHKCNNDVIYRTIIEYIDKKYFLEGKDLPYLTKMITSNDNIQTNKLQHEERVFGFNPPEIKEK